MILGWNLLNSMTLPASGQLNDIASDEVAFDVQMDLLVGER